MTPLGTPAGRPSPPSWPPPRQPAGEESHPHTPGPDSSLGRHRRAGPPPDRGRSHRRRHRPGGLAAMLRSVLSAPDLAVELLALADRQHPAGGDGR
ncbi:hypothetical protein [Streptomyces diastatochromogenes]|uniref:hypothetical protein n=1 Tax=Streptomyces diastatochromogenes TaxID=42236 RepID=UPI0036B2C87D